MTGEKDGGSVEIGTQGTGVETKREAVTAEQRIPQSLRRQAEIRRLRGKVDWPGDLDETRKDAE